MALELIADARRKIDLLLSDIVLPGMNGRQLVEQAGRMRPDLKMLLMSGFDREHGSTAAGAQGIEVLHKPLPPATMAQRCAPCSTARYLRQLPKPQRLPSAGIRARYPAPSCMRPVWS